MTTTLREAITVPYTPAQMFDLVNDVEAYPAFVPYCKKVHIQEKSLQKMVVALTLGKGWAEHTFTTENQLMHPHTVIMRLVEGPFSTFEGKWTFQTVVPDNCQLTLNLVFAFHRLGSKLLVQPLLEKVMHDMMGVLKQRAHVVYENR
jgi:ribosome-associated toxin RatA of RatAB toxin-antitoxin module